MGTGKAGFRMKITLKMEFSFMNVIEITALNKRVEEKKILENVSLNLEGGRAYKLLGGNGCGKTTLIKCILGILEYDSGIIKRYVGTQNYEIRQKELFKYFSVYFADTALPKNLKVCECIDLFKIVNEYNDNENELLDFFQIKSLLNKKYGVLSTGEKNIILLLTTLLSNWKVLILDEPFIGLDSEMKTKMGEFLRCSKDTDRTIIIVSHEDDGEFVGEDFYDSFIDGNNGFALCNTKYNS